MSSFRPTIRTRLTLVYGALVLGAGLVMLGLTWVLMRGQLAAATPSTIWGDSTVTGSTPMPTGTPLPSSSPGATATAQSKLDPNALHQFAVQVSASTASDALQALLVQGGIAVVVVSVIGAVLAWMLAGRMLRPVVSITQTARRIAEAPDNDHRMSERITVTGPDDELRRLSRIFNVMLERLDHSFEAQRRFVANASHELRTPLTVNRTLIEVALSREQVGEEVRVLGETLLQVNVRHERLIEGLLLLARSERDPKVQTFVDLDDVVEHVLDHVDLDGTSVTIRPQLDEAPTNGDPVLFEHLVTNLVGNGIRHNLAAGGFVSVRTGETADGKAELEVSNSGPVIPPYEVNQLVEPFHRLVDERMSRSGGVGLGLSIARAIVHAHKGEITLEARPQGGLTVTVRLPADPYGTDDDGEEG